LKGTTVADIKRLPGPRIDYYEWQLDAACRGMDSATFFHPAAERNSAREKRIAKAKAVCRACPAIQECLAHALRVQEPYGIWGGQSEDERAVLLGVESLRYPARIKKDAGRPPEAAQHMEPVPTADSGAAGETAAVSDLNARRCRLS
jgi:WhiB family redox-sensing transcriptional regulator